jgi:hypothetical protein
MVVRLYAVMVFRGERFQQGSDFTTTLDFDLPADVERRLSGHLEGHLRRSDIRRGEWHEYAMDVFPANVMGQATGGKRVFRWYLPYAPTEEVTP